MPRSMWKGSIAFGLVNIPIELYSAVRDHRPKFRLLHAKDEAPVQLRAGLPDGRQARRLGGPGQGLRVPEGAIRRPHQGRLQDRRDREDQDDRHPRLRRSRRRSTSGTSKLRTTSSRRKEPNARTRCCARHPRVGQDRHREDHPARRAASRGGRSDRGCARAHDDALCRRTGGSRGLQVSRKAEGIAPRRTEDGACSSIDNLGAKWDPGKVHGRIPATT